jgi:hypothetical protein
MHISVWHFPIYGPCVTRIYCRKHGGPAVLYTKKCRRGGKQIERGVGEGHATKLRKKNCLHHKTSATMNNIRKTYTDGTEKEEKAQALKINKIMGLGRLDTILSSYSISAIDYSSYNPS